MENQVKEAIDDIRPAIQNDGGDIEFISLVDNVVTVKLLGACIGCPMAQMTLKNGIERYLKSVVDENLVIESSDMY